MKLHFLATVSALLMIASNSAIAGCTPNVNGSTGSNTCIGAGVLYLNTTNSINNTGVGAQALLSTTSGTSNSAFGYQTLFNNTTGTSNVAVGKFSLYQETTATGNVAVGDSSLRRLVTGNSNTAVGYGALALLSATNSANNIALGQSAGSFLKGGNYNIYIGNFGPDNSSTESGVIRIGSPTQQTKTIINGIWNKSAPRGSQVLITSNGQLGTVSSSRRYKDDINTIGNVGDELQKLRPVTFRYKQADEEGKKPLQYGLIAEEVDAVMPQLVIRNQDGSPETVAYHYLPTLLLSEYQKDHKKLVEAEKSIQELKSEIDELKRITKKLAQGSSSKNKTASLQ